MKLNDKQFIEVSGLNPDYFIVPRPGRASRSGGSCGFPRGASDVLSVLREAREKVNPGSGCHSPDHATLLQGTGGCWLGPAAAGKTLSQFVLASAPSAYRPVVGNNPASFQALFSPQGTAGGRGLIWGDEREDLKPPGSNRTPDNATLYYCAGRLPRHPSLLRGTGPRAISPRSAACLIPRAEVRGRAGAERPTLYFQRPELPSR